MSPAAAARSPELPEALPPLVVLVGDEDRKKDRLLEEIVTRCGQDAAVISWNSDPADRPEVELSRLLCDLRSRPLFGGRRVVVARDGDGLLKRCGAGLSGALQATGGNLLVMLMRTLDQRTTFAREVKKRGQLIACERPKPDGDAIASGAGELLNAVQDEARRHGIELAAPAARELAARTGNDLMLVSTELAKLALYTHGRKRVDLADVEAVTPRSAVWDQFQLFQEVARGDAAAALRRLRGMLREGTTDRSGKRSTDPRSIGMAVLYMLHNKVRLLARYRELQAAGLDKEAMRVALGVRNPGQMFYLGKEANVPIVAMAEPAIAALAEADRDLKSSVAPQLVLERLLVRLALLVRPASRQAAR